MVHGAVAHNHSRDKGFARLDTVDTNKYIIPKFFKRDLRVSFFCRILVASKSESATVMEEKRKYHFVKFTENGIWYLKPECIEDVEEHFQKIFGMPL